MSRREEHWGEGRAVYRRPDVPANTPPGEDVIISSDEDHARVSAAVREVYAAVRDGGVPSWLSE